MCRTSSMTVYAIDGTNGTLTAGQTVSTLPADYSGHISCSQVQIHPLGTHLYVPNRGHNSIAGFTVDPSTGALATIGQVPTEPVPSAFSLDPAGKFVFAAGSASGNLASYSINSESGALTRMDTYNVGKRPMWVLVADIGG